MNSNGVPSVSTAVLVAWSVFHLLVDDAPLLIRE
jgi:hypothetical protein